MVTIRRRRTDHHRSTARKYMSSTLDGYSRLLDITGRSASVQRSSGRRTVNDDIADVAAEWEAVSDQFRDEIRREAKKLLE